MLQPKLVPCPASCKGHHERRAHLSVLSRPYRPRRIRPTGEVSLEEFASHAARRIWRVGGVR